MIKKSIVLTILVSLVGVGVALTLKADIGVGAWDALAATLAGMVGIPIGTMGIILNCSCVILQMVLLQKNFRKIQLLQFPISILFGSIINFMLYNIFNAFTVDAYSMKIIFLLMGYVVIAFSVGSVMVMNMVTFPLEGASMVVSDKLNKKFHIVRQLVDVLSVVLALVLIFAFSQPLSVREGTIIGVIIFGPLMGFFMKVLTPIFKKYDLIYNEK